MLSPEDRQAAGHKYLGNAARQKTDTMEHGWYRMKFEPENRKEKARPGTPPPQQDAAHRETSTFAQSRTAKQKADSIDNGWYRMKFEQINREKKAEVPPQQRRRIKEGDVINFGKHAWTVLQINGSTALILAKDIVEKRAFDKFRYGEIDWKNSALRAYLNHEFYQTFSPKEQRAILEMTMTWTYPDFLNHTLLKRDYQTKDYIFLLSMESAKTLFTADQFRACSSWWWLMDVKSGSVSIVDEKGKIKKYRKNYRKTGGVRPALHLDLNTYLSGY